MKTCDVCGAPLGLFKKFRYADGYICKDCYEKASNHCTETIVRKSLSEIKERCENHRGEITEEFEITKKVGNYILFDEKNGKICLPNNRMVEKKITEPEFYEVKDIKDCKISYQPSMTMEELEEKIRQKDEGTLKFLKVSLEMDGKKTRDITLIANPVRIKSFALKQSLGFAKRIEEEVKKAVEA